MTKAIFRILIVLLVVIVLMLALLLITPKSQTIFNSNPNYHLQIIVEDTDTYFYSQFLNGAKQASEDCQVYIEVVPLEPGKPNNLQETIEKGIYAGVDGIALRAGADIDIESLCNLAQANGVQLALYESENTLTLPIPNIATNAYSVGAAAAQLAIDASSGNCSAVLILDKVDDGLSANRSMKLQGIIDLFDEYPNAAIVDTYAVNSDFMATEQLMDTLFNNELAFDTIICLRETSTPMFAQRILDNDLISSVRLIGYGALPETLDYINRNIIHGSVCPDAQSIGYQTVIELVSALDSDHISDYSSANLYSITKQNVADFIRLQEENAA